jgi:hypothetical protein
LKWTALKKAIDASLNSRSKITKSQVPPRIIPFYNFCKTVLFTIHKNERSKRARKAIFRRFVFPCPESHCVVVTEDKSPQIFFLPPTHKKVIRMATERQKK